MSDLLDDFIRQVYIIAYLAGELAKFTGRTLEEEKSLAGVWASTKQTRALKSLDAMVDAEIERKKIEAV